MFFKTSICLYSTRVKFTIPLNMHSRVPSLVLIVGGNWWRLGKETRKEIQSYSWILNDTYWLDRFEFDLAIITFWRKLEIMVIFVYFGKSFYFMFTLQVSEVCSAELNQPKISLTKRCQTTSDKYIPLFSSNICCKQSSLCLKYPYIKRLFH